MSDSEKDNDSSSSSSSSEASSRQSSRPPSPCARFPSPPPEIMTNKEKYMEYIKGFHKSPVFPFPTNDMPNRAKPVWNIKQEIERKGIFTICRGVSLRKHGNALVSIRAKQQSTASSKANKNQDTLKMIDHFLNKRLFSSITFNPPALEKKSLNGIESIEVDNEDDERSKLPSSQVHISENSSEKIRNDSPRSMERPKRDEQSRSGAKEHVARDGRDGKRGVLERDRIEERRGRSGDGKGIVDRPSSSKTNKTETHDSLERKRTKKTESPHGSPTKEKKSSISISGKQEPKKSEQSMKKEANLEVPQSIKIAVSPSNGIKKQNTNEFIEQGRNLKHKADAEPSSTKKAHLFLQSIISFCRAVDGTDTDKRHVLIQSTLKFMESTNVSVVVKSLNSVDLSCVFKCLQAMLSYRLATEFHWKHRSETVALHSELKNRSNATRKVYSPIASKQSSTSDDSTPSSSSTTTAATATTITTTISSTSSSGNNGTISNNGTIAQSPASSGRSNSQQSDKALTENPSPSNLMPQRGLFHLRQSEMEKLIRILDCDNKRTNAIATWTLQQFQLKPGSPQLDRFLSLGSLDSACNSWLISMDTLMAMCEVVFS
eukprot:m.134946 g.134946  ORF g.134946 m.134946 type:complete len:603 (-) comp9790_c0_seq1:1594-3402(-)